MVQQHSTVQIMKNFPFFALGCAATRPVWPGPECGWHAFIVGSLCCPWFRLVNESVSDECERVRAVWPDADDFSDLKRRLFIDIGQWVILAIAVVSMAGEVYTATPRSASHSSDKKHVQGL